VARGTLCRVGARSPVVWLRHAECDSPRQHDAVRFLLDLLRDGPRPVTELQEQAREAGLGWRTVRRAKDTLRIDARRVPSESGGAMWVWQLPPGFEVIEDDDSDALD